MGVSYFQAQVLLAMQNMAKEVLLSNASPPAMEQE
jgi:hypothetical protein